VHCEIRTTSYVQDETCAAASNAATYVQNLNGSTPQPLNKTGGESVRSRSKARPILSESATGSYLSNKRCSTRTSRALTLDARGSSVDSRADSRAVPLAMSSRGYGVALSEPRDFQLDFASTAELFTFWVDGAALSFRIYTDPIPNRIVEVCTKASRRMRLPPPRRPESSAPTSTRSRHVLRWI